MWTTCKGVHLYFHEISIHQANVRQNGKRTSIVKKINKIKSKQMLKM